VSRKLRIQDRLLLLLADIRDLFEEVRDPGGLLSNYYQILYGWVPYRYRKSNYRATIERMLKVGYIEKVFKNNKVFLRLTSGGKKKLVRDFPIVLLVGQRWNKMCTLIVFDIEEVKKREREKFRAWLYQLGAGKMQQSAYILAYDLALEVQEAVESFGLVDEVKVFQTTLKFVKDKRAFAHKVWRLNKLEREYQRIWERLKKLELVRGSGREKLLREIRTVFVEVLISDPFLPREFLPDNWIGEKVRKLVKMSII
jgi:CRISPR-associated endonuclease Cas2